MNAGVCRVLSMSAAFGNFRFLPWGGQNREWEGEQVRERCMSNVHPHSAVQDSRVQREWISREEWNRSCLCPRRVGLVWRGGGGGGGGGDGTLVGAVLPARPRVVVAARQQQKGTWTPPISRPHRQKASVYPGLSACPPLPLSGTCPSCSLPRARGPTCVMHLQKKPGMKMAGAA